MRAIWAGSISFGLINIPVRLFSATEEHAISFDLLHKKDLSRIRYARICKEEEKEIPYEDVVKGYEYQEGEYVVMNPEDFKHADPKRVKAIEIMHFSDASEIDSIYFERPYYLEPGKGADKAYALLRETLRRSEKVAIVKYVFHDKEHLGLLKDYEDAIILNQMRFATEIRNLEELKLPNKDVINKKELEMAMKLVDQLSDKFRPMDYHDEYTEELKELIEAKVKGTTKKAHKKGTTAKASKIHDITALLEASLKETKGSKKKASRKKPA